jgi:hypothetical protein
MEAMLYASDQGALVLVPACFEPSIAVEEAYGHLHLCCRLSLANPMRSALGRRIVGDFDRCSYALLSRHEVTRLLGTQALWGSSDRRCTPREVQLSGQQVRHRLSLWRRLAGKPTSMA